MDFRAWVDGQLDVRVKVTNDSIFLSMRYPLGPVPCNFSEDFTVHAAFGRSLDWRMFFPVRTSICAQLDDELMQQLTMHTN